MIPRRVGNDAFRIVRKCYVFSISEDEALMGPFPDVIRRYLPVIPRGEFTRISSTIGSNIETSWIQESRNCCQAWKSTQNELADPNAKIQLNPEKVHYVFPQIRQFDIY